MIFYTDYPIKALGDKPDREALVRSVEPLEYDNNKYCFVRIGYIFCSIKVGYIYTKKGRYGEVPVFNPKEYFMRNNNG